MKTKILIYLLAYLFNLNIYSQGEVKINGTGFNTFKNVTLKIYDPSTLSYKAIHKTSLSKEGTFTLTTQFKGINLYELNFDEKDFIHLSVENVSNITVKRNGINTSILGSLSSQKIIDFEKDNEKLQAKYFGQLKVDIDKAMSEKNQEKIDKLQKQAEVAIQNFLIEFRALIVSLGITPAAFYAIQYSDFNKELNFIESRLFEFKREIPNASITLALEKQIKKVKSITIGNIAPELNGVDKFGNKISLANFKGKVLLIDFWAHWCRACRIENPKLVAVYNFYKPKGFDIVSISQKSTINQWESAIQKDGIGYWTQVLDQDNRLSDLYGISSLPQNLLLDESGRIIAKNISAKELEEILSKRKN